MLQKGEVHRTPPHTAARRTLQMRNKLTTILLVLAFFAGLSLLLYPTVSDYWNSLHASQAVADYAENVRNLEAEKYEQVLQDARNYNQMLPYKHTTFALSEEDKVAYDTLLDISGTGVMGYIEIPTINISLPVYHGTEDAVLQIAVGHLEWSSLPVGGEDTHCVLSGHRGLPSAKLFTNLDKLVVGDKFVMRVLDEVLTYEVDQILIVEPTDVSTLIIEAGKDLCTLVTCTPYGINSHRLLVRGHRIENQEEAQAIRVTSDAIQIEPLIVAPAVALPMLLVLLMILLVSGGKTKSAGGKKNAKTE